MATQAETVTEAAAPAPEAAVKADPFLATFDEDEFDEEVFVGPPEDEKEEEEEEEEEEEVKKGCFGRKKKKKPEKAPSVPFWKLYKFSSRIERLLIFVGLVCGFIHGALLPAFTIFFGDTLQSFGNVGSPDFDPEEALQSIVDVSLNFVWLGIAAFVTGLLQVYILMWASQRQARRIRTTYMRALLSQEMAWYDEVDSAELAQRVHGDVQKIEDGTGDKVSSALQFIAMFFVGFIIGFIYGWRMTLVILAITPVLAASGAFFAKMSADAVTEGQTAYAKAGSIAQESFSLIRIVAAYALEPSEIKRYGEALKIAVKKGYRKALFMGLGLGLTMFVILSSYGLAFWYGNRLVKMEIMEPGAVITVFFSVIIGAMALGQASPSINAISEAMGAAPKVYEVIARQSEIDAFSTEGQTSTEVKGRIEIKDVDFTYRARQDRLVLNKLNLTIEEGTTVALVGESGCGKSTTIQMLERFYDPMSGSVTLDGVDLKDYNVQWLRGQMGFVQQMPVLFAMSIRENIELGAGVTVSKDGQGNRVVEHMQVTEDEVIAAAKMANAHDFIKKLPQGYDTQIGARGAQLSGGQKQRIAIARALIRNPKILLLDEATSALDTQSERQVQQAIEKAQEGRTTVVIAHRLSTIRNADKIAVFVAGEVQELGTHEQLMEIESGVYRNLVNLQNISSEQDKESLLTTNVVDEKSMTKGSVTQKSGGDTVTGVKETDDSEEEPKVDKKRTKAATRRAIAMSKDDLMYIIPGCFGAVLSGLVWPVFSLIFTKIIVVLVDPSSDSGEIRKWALTFVGIGCGALVSNFLQLWLLGVAGERLTCRLREMLFKAIIRQDVGFFDLRENSVGVLTARLGGDAAKVKGATGERLGNFVMIGSTMLCGIIIAFQACWRVALVVLATVPAFAIGGMIQMQMMSGLSGELSKLFANANTIASTSVDCIQTVTSLGAGERFISDYDDELAVPAKAGKKKALTAGFAFAFTEFCMFGIWALTFWYSTRITEFCDFEGMLTALTALLFSAMTLGQVAALMPDAADAGAAAAKIFEIIDRPSPVDPLSDEGEKLETCEGDVKLENVVFRYPARPEVTVLKGLTVEAPRGKTLALVGPSGSGKSTVALLTERFYDPYSGVVTIDGKSIESLNVGSFRDHIGFVTQEPELFSTTIRENIMHGLPKNNEEGTVVTDEQIINAAKLANAHKFIMKLPEGYDTNVGAHGGQLSGGQRQRIAIARAVVRDPKILLLDEATSALDSDSEKVVQAALDKAASGRTTIVIAHRLSTIRNADTIVVIAEGNVREKGTHDQLVQIPNGIYSGLVKQQAL